MTRAHWLIKILRLVKIIVRAYAQFMKIATLLARL